MPLGEIFAKGWFVMKLVTDLHVQQTKNTDL